MFVVTHQVRALAALAMAAVGLLFALSVQRASVPSSHVFADERQRRAAEAVVAAIRPRNLAGMLGALPGATRCTHRATAETLLASIDASLAQMSATQHGGSRPLKGVYAVDRGLLAASMERERISADSLCAVLRVFARDDGAALTQLDWNERRTRPTSGSESVATLPSYWGRSSDPWLPLPGCAFLRNEKGLAYFRSRTAAALCSLPGFSSVAMNASDAPADWSRIQASLLKFSPGANTMARVPTRGPLAVAPQAPHAISTLDAHMQQIAQAVALCMTGDAAVCRTNGIDLDTYREHYEGAAARMIGILVLDIPSGGIDALGSAHTRCFEQEHDGPGRDADCPALTTTPRLRPRMLANHALHAAAMPGSLVKPVTANALASGDRYRAWLLGAGAETMRHDLQHSLSANFHARLFCADRGFEDCTRTRGFVESATALGWNAGCIGQRDCLVLDVGRGRYVPASDDFLQVSAGRLGLRRDEHGRWAPVPSSFGVKWARECSHSGRGWEKCRGGAGSASELLAEAWGQGNAEASPATVALMFAKLGSAANNRGHVPLPHLYGGEPGAGGAPSAESVPTGVAPQIASLIVSGMALTHVPGGTAHSACMIAWRSTAACARARWVAGKTGTPQFSKDALTLTQRAAVCERAEAEWAEAERAGRRPTRSVLATRASCAMSPYKWYAALVQSGSRGWDKVVVVVAERNWNSRTGLVDSPGDLGVNIAARAAFELIGRAWGMARRSNEN